MAQAKCTRCNNVFDVNEAALDAMRMVTCPNCSSSFQFVKDGQEGSPDGSQRDDFDDFFEVGAEEQTDIKQKPQVIEPSQVEETDDFIASTADFIQEASSANPAQDLPEPAKGPVATDDEVFGGLDGFEEFLSIDEEGAVKKPPPVQQKPSQPPVEPAAPPKQEKAGPAEPPKKDLLDDAFEELFADSPEPQKPQVKPRTAVKQPPPVTPEVSSPKPSPEASKPKPKPEKKISQPEFSGESSFPRDGKKVDTVSDEAFEALFHDIKGPKPEGSVGGEISSGLGLEAPKRKKSILKLILFILLPILILGALAYFVVFTQKGLLGISYYSYFIEGYRKPGGEVMRALESKFENVKVMLNRDYYPDYLSSLKDLRDILSKDTRFIPAHAYAVFALLLASGDPLNQGVKKEIESFLLESEKLSPALNEGIVARAFYDYRSGNLAQAEKSINRLHSSGVHDPLSYEILGNIYFSRGDYLEAKNKFNKSIELNPENLRVKHSLSMALYSEGSVEEALKILATLKDEKKHLPSAIDWNYINWQNFAKTAEAKADFKDILDKSAKMMSDFNFARLSSYLGDIYFKEGSLDNALEVLLLGLKRESFNSSIAYRLGIIHLEKKEPDKAAEFLKKAVSLSPREIDYHVQYSQALREGKRLDQALEEANKALEINSENVDALYEKGLAEKELKKYPDALNSFGKVLSLKPNHLDSIVSSGEIKLFEKNFAEAKDFFEKAISLNKNIARAHSGLGAAYMGLGNRQKALLGFEKAERLSPDNADITINIGKSLLSMGKYDEAKANFQKVIKLDNKNVEAYVGLGDILYMKKNYADALSVYKSGLNIEPKNVDLKVKIAKCNIELLQFKPALEELRQASKILIDYFPVHINLGIVYRNLGNMDDALRELEKSTHIRPDSADAHYEYGLTLMRNAQVTVGLPHVFKAIEIDSKHIKALQTIVDFYYETNNMEKAVEYSKKILKVDPARWKSSLKLAECYRKMGKDKLAYGIYLNVIKQNKDNPSAYLGAGKILEDKSQYDKALKFYKMAVKISPQNPKVYYHLGFGYKYLENKPMAVKSFKKYLKLAPSSPESETIKEEIYYLEKN